MSLLNQKTGLILSIILLLAAFLRLWNLASVPPSASMDEASIGYNAYSILKTGGDEYGEIPTLSHRSYDDWRRATYLYLVLPFVALLGLNELSIRLPAVILSILTVWAIYHVGLNLFSTRSSLSISTALFSSLLLAISPWHIYISRLGHESNACLAFFVFGIFLFLKGVRAKGRGKMLFSFLFFTLSMISYYSGQAFIPLFVLGLFILFRKDIVGLLVSDKKTGFLLLLFLIVLIPIFRVMFSPEAMVRFQGTSTFKPEAHQELFAERVELRNKTVERNDIVGTLLYNRHLFPFVVFVEGYIAHYNPKWLLTNFFAEPHKVPQMGLLFVWEALFIILGLYILIFKQYLQTREKLLVLLWLFFGAIPAAIATQAPHAMRAYNLVPVWQIIAALGMSAVIHRFKNFTFLIVGGYIILVLSSVASFYNNYFILFPKEQSKSFHYALSQTIPYVLSEKENYQKIIFSNTDNLFQSYMLFLYHSRYDPSLYQQFGGTVSGGFAQNHKFDKYEFRLVDLKKENIQPNTLYVVNANEVSGGTRLRTFTDLGGVESTAVITW